MKKSKFSESQIIKIPSEQEKGKTVIEICREYGISQPTFYQCKQNFGFSLLFTVAFASNSLLY